MSLKTEESSAERRSAYSDTENVIIRFAGDSGDGMQITGSMFTQNAALVGNDISTLPDFPAEIRAPAGTLPGVSGFQLNFSSRDIKTPGDAPEVLVAMNPAALKVNLCDLIPGGMIVLNSDMFGGNNLKKAGYTTDPRETGELSGFQVISVPISNLTLQAVKPTGIGQKDAARCKNMFALGLMFWVYDRPLDPTIRVIQQKFGKKPEIAEANRLALQAGYNYADTVEIVPNQIRVSKCVLPKRAIALRTCSSSWIGRCRSPSLSTYANWSSFKRLRCSVLNSATIVSPPAGLAGCRGKMGARARAEESRAGRLPSAGGGPLADTTGGQSPRARSLGSTSLPNSSMKRI